MYYCKDCNIEITKGTSTNRHLLSIKHQQNIGGNAYLRGKIYKIVCLDKNDNRIYIGSTIYPLHKRLLKHKQDKKRFDEKKDYSTKCESYAILHNCKIELIEEYPCKNKIELTKREQYHIDNNECINRNRAFLSVELSKQLNKEYREKHKERINAYRSKETDCECGLTYTPRHKARHFKTKQHQDRMKGIIKVPKSKSIECECGLTYTKWHKQRHFKTKIHQDRMTILSNKEVDK